MPQHHRTTAGLSVVCLGFSIFHSQPLAAQILVDPNNDGSTDVVVADSSGNFLTLVNPLPTTISLPFGLTVGNTAAGELQIAAGGVMSNFFGYIGRDTSATGTATVTGPGSQWNNSEDLAVGEFGTGTLDIEDGGIVSSRNGRVGEFGTGTVTVTGAGSRWNNSEGLAVGEFGTGTLNIEDGGIVSSSFGGIGLGDFGDSLIVAGFFPNFTGAVTVTGVGSQWNNSEELTVGRFDDSTGTLNIEDGGVVSSRSGRVGNQGTGTVTVTGAGSQWNNSEDLAVGELGRGTLNIEDGGVVSSRFGYVTSGGTVTVTGAGSQWNNSEDLTIGHFDTSRLNIEDGGAVSNTNGVIDDPFLSTSTVTVTGVGSQWNNSEDLIVGEFDTGALDIEDGGVVNSSFGYIGLNPSATGTVTVTGPGSQWNNSGGLDVGLNGTGTLNIEDGGVVSNRSGRVGEFGTGTVTVTGAGSQWNNSEDLIVGEFGDGTLDIEDGGVVSSSFSYIGFGFGFGLNLGDATGTVTVTGVGSQWDNSEDLVVGFSSATGTLDIEDGGIVNSRSGRVGETVPTGDPIMGFDPDVGFIRDATDTVTGAGSQWNNSTVTVTGAGSQWNNSEDLTVGAGGGGVAATGTLNIEDGGAVSNTNGFIGGVFNPGTVTVTGAGSQWNNSNDLFIGRSSRGIVHQMGGTVTVGGDLTLGSGVGSAYNLSDGVLDLTSGGLIAGPGGAAFNFTGGTLKDAATIDLGQTFVQSGGTLAPGSSPGTTTIIGGYTLGSSGTLAIELGGTTQDTEFDFVDVVGDLDLAGILDVSLIDGFDPIFGDRFDILDWDTLTGMFDTVVLPTLTDGLTWNLDDLYLTGELAVLLQGDVNGDGEVDILDFVVLADHFGDMGELVVSDGDFNGDDAVDILDFVILGDHFGNTSTAGIASVPEPGSLALLGLGGLTFIRRRRRA